MADPHPIYHHLRCEQLGPVTVAAAAPKAFAESTHPDDWTPHRSDAVTNRELRADLSLLAASSGPVVLDLRQVTGLLGDATCWLLLFARQMADANKPLAVCAVPPVLEVIELCGLSRRVPCFSALAAAIGQVGSGAVWRGVRVISLIDPSE